MSLLETVMGLTLVLLVFVTGINLIPLSLRARRSAEQKLLAGNLAQSTLEEQSGRDFTQVQSTSLPDVTLQGTLFHVQLRVDEPKPIVKRLTVEVRWDPNGNLSRQTSICRLPR